MHFHRTETINDPAMVEALGDMLIVAPAFKSYTHHGAAHAPVMFELYRNAKDNVMERPIATAVRDDSGAFIVTEMPSLGKGKKS